MFVKVNLFVCSFWLWWIASALKFAYDSSGRDQGKLKERKLLYMIIKTTRLFFLKMTRISTQSWIDQGLLHHYKSLSKYVISSRLSSWLRDFKSKNFTFSYTLKLSWVKLFFNDNIMQSRRDLPSLEKALSCEKIIITYNVAQTLLNSVITGKWWLESSSSGVAAILHFWSYSIKPLVARIRVEQRLLLECTEMLKDSCNVRFSLQSGVRVAPGIDLILMWVWCVRTQDMISACWLIEVTIESSISYKYVETRWNVSFSKRSSG